MLTMVCLGYSLLITHSQMDSYWFHEVPPTKEFLTSGSVQLKAVLRFQRKLDWAGFALGFDNAGQSPPKKSFQAYLFSYDSFAFSFLEAFLMSFPK